MMLPLVCTSVTCPEREGCLWRQEAFAGVKAANAAGRSRDCFQPGEVCPLSLNRALHSFSGAAERWVERRAAGMTDEDLAWAIGKEFGEWGSQSCGPGNTHMGKSKDPKIWFGNQADKSGKRRAPDLHGKALVAAVRELLGISMPKAAQAQVKKPEARAPWAGLPLMKLMEARG